MIFHNMISLRQKNACKGHPAAKTLARGVQHSPADDEDEDL
jgi:hypothetical protein